MSSSSVVVFSKTPNLLRELTRVLPNVHFHEAVSEKDDKLLSTEILIGDPNLFGPIIYDLSKLKWVQSTWAGVDAFLPYVQTDKKLLCVYTRFTGEHFGRLMSEFVVSSIVNHERNIYKQHKNQKQKLWTREGCIGEYRAIADLNVGILGIGSIGNRIGKLLKAFGGNIFGMGRRPEINKSKDTQYLSKYYSRDSLPELLKICDYIVNVLPSTLETKGLLNGNILENCKDKKAVFINVGRGSVISDEDLINSLNKGWLSAAILDVFNVEPLPKDSPLWSMPQVVISPHSSGMTRSKDIAEQFRENYQLYVDNKPMPATLNFEAGY